MKSFCQMVMITISLFASLASATTAAEKLKTTIRLLGEEVVTSPTYHPGTLRHIVLFRYRDDVNIEQKREVKKRFLRLALECKRFGRPYIASIETGSQNSGEGVDQELEQAFIVTFRSEGDRNYYVGRDLIQKPGNFDTAHDEFKKFVGPLLHQPVNPSGVLVFDYQVDRQIHR